MNPFAFKDASVRLIALKLAAALRDFDEKASAALADCEKRLADTENPVAASPSATAPARPILPPHIAEGLAGLNSTELQDIDNSRDDYSHGLSGRV